MKKLHPAVEALYNIMKVQDWTEFCPEKSRKEALDKWLKSWIVEVEFSQSVVSSDYLTSEYDDLIKFKLCQSMAEDIAEDCALFSSNKKTVMAKMAAFRRKERIRGQNGEEEQ